MKEFNLTPHYQLVGGALQFYFKSIPTNPLVAALGINYVSSHIATCIAHSEHSARQRCDELIGEWIRDGEACGNLSIALQ
jgi:hypothetical protein